MLEAHSDEEEPWRFRDLAASVARIAVGAEDGQVDPRVVRREARAPHDSRRGDHLGPESREATLMALQSPQPSDTCVGQGTLGDADARVATGTRPDPEMAAETRLHGRPALEGPDPIEKVTSEHAARQVASVAPCQPDGPVARQFERDLRAAVPRTDDEHRSVGEREGVAVLARVQLHDMGVQRGRDGRHAGTLEGSRRHDEVVRLEGRAMRTQHEAVAIEAKGIDARRGAHRQVEALRVALQVVCHVVLVGEVRRRGRKGHPR